jgi:hypothetical protein
MNDPEQPTDHPNPDPPSEGPKRRIEKDLPPPPPGAERDERFPSGPWTGFFLEKVGAGRHWMELNLTFRSGKIAGDGRDRIGQFVITGRYSAQDGVCRWVKRYIGKHDVRYEGYNEGRGIWGLWNIDVPPLREGFHIWPIGTPDPTQNRLSEEDDIPVAADTLEVSDFATVESEPLVGAGA